MFRASLWHVSLNWPQAQTIPIGLLDSDTGAAVLEKVKKNLRRRAINAGKIDKFQYISSSELAFRFSLHYADGTGFHRIDPRKRLEHYKINIDNDEASSADDGRLLYMRVLSLAARANDLWPDSQDMLSESAYVVSAASATSAPSPAAAEIDIQPPEAGVKRKRDNVSEEEQEQEEEIVELTQHGGYLSKTDVKCVYSGMSYEDAQHNRSSSVGCRHHLDLQSLEVLLQVVHRDTKKKTALCPVAGCSGTWTKLRSRPDPEFQALVMNALAYHDTQEKGDCVDGYCYGGGGSGTGGACLSSGNEIIELD